MKTIYAVAISIILLFSLQFTVSAQSVKFTDNPDQFISDAKTLATNSKNEASIKIVGELESAWGALNDGHKKKVVGIAQLIQKKKLSTKDHLIPFLGTVAYSIKNKNIPASKLDTLLFVTHYMVENAKAPKLKSFVETTKLFMEQNLLYKSTFNKLRVTGGNYAFGFAKGEEEDEETPVEDAPVTEDIPQDSTNSGSDSTAVKPEKKKEKNDWFSDWDAPVEQVYQDWGVQSDTGNVLEQTFAPAEQPRIVGAYLYLSGCNLEMVSKFDSTVIEGTKGTLMLGNRIFVGDGGKFSWAVANMPETFVDLKKYNFNIISPKFSAEDVTIHSPNYVDTPIQGVFEFKSTQHKRAQDIKYPRFMSYHGNIAIKNLGENIKYLGGFSLDGNKVFSSNLDETPALIEVFDDGKLKFKSLAKLFKLGDSLIISDLVSIVIYQKDDSITHQGVSFNYNKNTHLLKLVKDKYGYRHTPYIDSYHGLEITCDMLSWNLQSKEMQFDMITARDVNAALFESGEYFQHDIFDRLKGLYPFHPLIMAVSYAKEKDTDIYSADDLIRDYKVREGAVISAMKELVKKGFITFNSTSREVHIQPKAWHYFKSAKGKKDYDELQVVSVGPVGTNATLDLENNVLTVRGVKKLHLSKALNVYVLPTDQSIKIMQNRDMSFTGQVFAGHFLFQGREFRFDYDSFFVDMQMLDSLKLLVDTKDLDASGHIKVQQLKSQIEATSGTLFINKKDNKSNKKDMPEYPLFKSNQGSSVFYNSPQTFGGVYQKRIFFEVPPFVVDSLNSNVTNGIAFHGTFHSDNIFPDFEDILTVMPDLSLGFKRKTPKKGGFPLFKDKGNYQGEIKIDYSGLRGKGTIQYLSTTLKAEDFVFFPDSVLSVGTSAATKDGKFNGVYYPDLEIGQHDLHWNVYKDTMIIANFNKELINLYKKTVQLDGRAFILKDGTYADGTVKTRGSETTSNMVRFQDGEFNATEAYFTVESNDPTKPALRSTNVNLHFDFKAKHAYFSPAIVGFPANEFPFLKYKTSMNDGDWDLEKQIITLKMPKDGDIKKSYFRSYATDQDSLYFNAEYAVYDIKALTLNIKGVPEIRVTDSKIFPDKNEVSIKASTKLNPLVNAKILTDTTTKFHNLHSGNIRISSRSEYLGDAIYDYVNAGNDTMRIKMQKFKFEEFEGKHKAVDKHTIAQATLRPQDTFMLAPRIYYKGDINLRADKKNLSLDGYIKLKLHAFTKTGEWLKYNFDLIKDTIQVDISNLVIDENTTLMSGLCLSDGHYKMYPTFLSKKKHSTDFALFQSTGSKLHIEKGGDKFLIGPEDKLNGKTLIGNTYSYDDSLNTVEFSGNINMYDYNFYGNDFTVDVASTGFGNLDSSKFEFNSTMKIKLNAPIKAFNLMAEQVAELSATAQIPTAIPDSSGLFITHIANLTSEKEALKYQKQLESDYKPLHKVVKSVAENFVITDVKLQWNETLQAWHSVGDIGIANIYKKDVNYRVKGYIEIKKFAKGDKFHLFIEPTEGNWYYILFEFNRLSMSSSNEDFNNIIRSASKGKTDNGKYCFVLADPQEKLVFIKNFTRHYIDKLPPHGAAPKANEPTQEKKPANNLNSH